jgi:hypothetical protein
MEKALESMIPHMQPVTKPFKASKNWSSRWKKALADKLEDTKRHIR